MSNCTLFYMKFETVDTFKKIKTESTIFRNLSVEEIKELQKELLAILKDFSMACKNNEIPFALGGGSALGAVRHHGFVPWDDDIDINMRRSDFERFIKAYNDDLACNYWLHYPEKNADLGLGFARLRKKGTILKTREDYYNDESGIFIDIFFVENTFNCSILRFFHGFLSLMTGFLLSCRNFYRNRKLYLQINNSNIIFRIKVLIGFILSILPVSFYCRQWNNTNRICKNDKSRFVVIPVGRRHFFKELYERKDIEKLISMKFEDTKMPVYHSYDKYLKNMYGDYMTIPSDADKEAHLILKYEK